VGSKVLFVDDRWQEEQAHLAHLPKEIEVIYEAIGANALKHLQDDPAIRTVLLDMQFDGQAKQGEQILNEIKDQFPEIPVIILTSMQSVELALRLVLRERKAYDYFVKSDIDADRFRICIENAIGLYELKTDAFRCTDKGVIIGNSPALEAALRMASRAAQTDSTVLITGETGTGKELLANAIHRNSRRRGGAYKEINCAAIPAELIESEMFGNEPGAFADAKKRRIGLIEAAHGGTLFLDEVGELSLAAQAKLLRALEEREIRRLGGTGTIKVDFRLIAATHRDLAGMVKEGTFREDMYYRINVFSICLPLLRERREDIPALVAHFVESVNNKYQLNKGLTSEAVVALQRYDWPGNIRQLSNVVERAMLSSDRQSLTPEDFPDALFPSMISQTQNPVDQWIEKLYSRQARWAELGREFKGTSEILRDVLRGIIQRWIRENGDRPSGNELAELLGTNRNHVNQVMNQVGLKLKDFDA
jgi:two-component system response regulator AtoC